jgi:hypothetical protein
VVLLVAVSAEDGDVSVRWPKSRAMTIVVVDDGADGTLQDSRGNIQLPAGPDLFNIGAEQQSSNCT